jgi:UDP-N-acetyl-D-glucosamine dehydrogenase
LAKLRECSQTVGVIGLGYVGLPLAVTIAARNLTTIGFDTDPAKLEILAAGTSYIDAVGRDALDQVSTSGRFSSTSEFARLGECDVIVICVPTPLTPYREPDLSYVIATAEQIARYLTPASLVVLESTTFPGTTREVLTPVLERSGLKAGHDFFVAYSPEREDPGNVRFRTATIPKVVAGDGAEATELVTMFYRQIIDEIVPVSSSATAEAVKITENVFRAVNIALVNELKVIFDAMGIDVWEVIDSAATKPFGFMPFYPGPGLGGHCIPIDPFYLSWKAREYELTTRFIELAGEININMPKYVVGRLRQVLDERTGRGLKGTHILLMGIAYKKNVSDTRESPAVRIMELLREQGALVDYFDPHVPVIPKMRSYPHLHGISSIPFEGISGTGYDAIVIATDHDAVDYAHLIETRLPIVDTRNVISRLGLSMATVYKA